MVGSRRVRGVVFDVGYTLIDETRRWREWGEWLGVQPETLFDIMRTAIADGFLTQCDLGFGMIGSSERWGVEKPDPRYFLLLAQAMKLPTDRLAYVGDRLESDIAPAAAAGMLPIFIRRGLWAEVLEGRPEKALAHAVIDSLDTLPAVLP